MYNEQVTGEGNILKNNPKEGKRKGNKKQHSRYKPKCITNYTKYKWTKFYN